MFFRTLGLCLLFVSVAAYAQGRKPAVEDFVGIEIDQPEVTPQGTEPLFNLEQDLSKHVVAKAAEPNAKTNSSSHQIRSEMSLTSVIGLTLAVGLPLIMWFMILSHMRKRASVESASNIEVLENYRKTREQNRKSEDSIKKVS